MSPLKLIISHHHHHTLCSLNPFQQDPTENLLGIERSAEISFLGQFEYEAFGIVSSSQNF